MKSERRHELQENELAVALGRINRVIEPYSKLIALAVAAIFLAVIAFALYRSRLSENRSDATLQLIQASGTGNAESLAAIAQQYPDTPIAPWARLYQGDAYLAQGMNMLFQNRDEAETLFDQAKEAFETALATSEQQLIRSRANLGLARIAESMGNAEQAIAAYEQVIAASESEEMIDWAEQRIAALSSKPTQQFLAWFSEQDLSPPAEPSLPPSLPGESGLPSMPDFGLPDLGAGAEAAGETDEEAEQTADQADTAAVEEEPVDDSEPAPTGDSVPADPESTDTGSAAQEDESPEPTEQQPNTNAGDAGNTDGEVEAVTEQTDAEAGAAETENEPAANDGDGESPDAETASGERGDS